MDKYTFIHLIFANCLIRANKYLLSRLCATASQERASLWCSKFLIRKFMVHCFLCWVYKIICKIIYAERELNVLYLHKQHLRNRIASNGYYVCVNVDALEALSIVLSKRFLRIQATRIHHIAEWTKQQEISVHL